jgi:transposase
MTIDGEYAPFFDEGYSSMSLPSQPLDPIPTATARVAQAAFPRSTRVMQMRDHLGLIYDQATLIALYPHRGKPAEAP